MMTQLQFATATHHQAYELVLAYIQGNARVMALTLTGSAARNEGSFDSDLDFDVFFAPDMPQAECAEVLAAVEARVKAELVLASGARAEVGRFFDIDLHIAPTQIAPDARGWTSGPDAFELEIGNIFVYSHLIFERAGYYHQAQARYLPYYDEALRQTRLAATLKYCHNNINHIAPYVARGLYFQAFRRLYDATREFLQALFIAKRVYPIAYDKWVKKQLVEILGLPDLYKRFVALYEVQHLESEELAVKGEQLREYIEEYIAA